MKQTNGALTLLLKAYRSVFRNAYFKGIASAVVLTAGLSAGAASADTTNHFVTDQEQAEDFTVTGTDQEWPSYAGNVFAGNITVNGTYSVGFTSVTDGGNIYTKGVTINNGNLTFGRDSVGSGLYGASYDSTRAIATITDGFIQNGGSVRISNIDAAYANFTLANGQLTLSGSDIFAYGVGSQINMTGSGLVRASDLSTADISLSNMAVTLSDGSNVGALDALSVTNNSTINMTGNNVLQANDEGDGTGLTIQSSTINVVGTSNSLVGPEISIDNSKITVSGSAELTLRGLDGSTYGKEAAAMNAAMGNNSVITIENGGKLIVNDDKTADDARTDADEEVLSVFNVNGGTINNAGEIKVVGIMNVSDAANLNSTNDGSKITVSGGTSDQYAKLAISSAKLKAYLEDSTTANVPTPDTDFAGLVALQNDGTLEFTDDAVIELGGANPDFDLVSGSSSGGIYVDKGSIVGKNISISDVIAGASNINTSLNVKAYNLIVGDGNIDGGNSLSQLNGSDKITFGSLQNVKFDADASVGNVFTIDKAFSVINETDEEGFITGDDIKVTTYDFNVAGKVTSNVDITLSSGSIVAGKDDAGNLYEGDTYLTLNGEIISDTTATGGSAIAAYGYGAKNSVEDSSVVLDTYTATVDLRGVTAFKTISGGSSLTTFQAHDNGEIILTGNQLSQLLDDSNDNTDGFATIIYSGGTLQVDGTLQADFSDIVDYNAVQGHQLGIQSTAADKATIIADSAVLTNQSGASTTELNLQNAVLKVNSLTVNDLRTEASGTQQVQVKNVTLTSGDYVIADQLSSSNENIILGDDANVVLGNKDTADGTIDGNLQLTSNSTVRINNGDWDAQDITISDSATFTVAGKYNYDTENDVYGAASLTGDKLTVNDGSLTVGGANATTSGIATGKVTFTEVDLNATASVVVDNGGTFVIEGSEDAKINTGATPTSDPLKGVNYVNDAIQVNGGGNLTFGSVATDALYSRSNGTLTVAAGLGQIDDQGGWINLTFDEGEESFSAQDLTTLKQGMFGIAAGSLIDGVLNVGNASLKIEGIEDHEITWEQFKPFADVVSDVTSNDLLSTKVTNVKNTDATSFRGHVGSVVGAEDVSTININGDTSLHFAEGNDGMFASYKDGDQNKLANVNIQAGSLELVNGGTIGSVQIGTGLDFGISGPDQVTVEGNVTGDGEFWTEGETLVNGNINVDELNVDAGSLTSGLLADGKQGNINANDVWVGAGASLNTNALTADELTVAGGSAAAETLTLENRLTVLDGGLVDVNVLDANTADLYVGIDEQRVYDPETDSYTSETEYSYSSGFLEVNRLDLNGNIIKVDPEYGKDASLVAVGKFDDDEIAQSGEPEGGIINGSIYLGQNAAVGVGTDLAGLRTALSSYYAPGTASLQADGVGTVLYLNKNIQLDNGIIYLDAHNSIEQIERDIAEATADNTLNDITLGENTAIVMTMDAFHADAEDIPVIKINDANATVGANGGKIILSGRFNTRDALDIIGDNNGGVSIVGENGLTVQTENGVLSTVLSGDDAGMNVELEFASDARQRLGGASDPVFNTLVSYFEGYNDWQAGENAEDELVSGVYTEAYQQHIANGGTAENFSGEVYEPYYNALLNNSLQTGNGSAAESAARMAVYGGAVQAALAAGQTSSEAIASRMGMGNPASVLTYADNADGAGIWLAPVYKNHDSDGFDAEGVDYGVDMDLYGVSLGVDYTFAQGFRAGVMFNVGSGDADGKGAGSAVSNDFDYWGASLYAGYTYGNFAVTADLGYTAVDNDLDANSGFAEVGKMTAQTDSESITLGVNAQYKFELDVMDITPHIGARFTRIDMDDYSVDSAAGKLAEFNADSMNIFSIPVGVSFSKDITAGSWNVQPALDLVVTAKTGDDELDGDVDWAGISNLTTATSTEVLDSVTYGAALGISAKTGAFSLGLGVNYVGSENADEFGVQANARFTF